MAGKARGNYSKEKNKYYLGLQRIGSYSDQWSPTSWGYIEHKKSKNLTAISEL